MFILLLLNLKNIKNRLCLIFFRSLTVHILPHNPSKSQKTYLIGFTELTRFTGFTRLSMSILFQLFIFFLKEFENVFYPLT